MLALSQVSLLDWLLIILAAFVGLACLWIGAWQIVRASSLPILFGRSIPTWFLIGGGLLSVLVIIGVLGQELEWFAAVVAEIPVLGQISLLDRVFMIFAGLFGLSCLLIAGWQARPSSPPVDNLERLQRSILVGFMTSGCFISIFVIAGILDMDFQWSFEGLVTSLCLILPFQAMATVGSYVQFGYASKIRQHLSKVAQQKGKKDP